MKYVEHLINKYASASLGDAAQAQAAARRLSQWSLANELADLLHLRNGFMAFESSLHVFPVDDTYLMNAIAWNSHDLWKRHYTFDLPQFFCFAENIFGEQFCTCDGIVCRFDPETGNLEQMASSIDGWVEAILDDYNLHTGYPLGHEWQANNGPLDSGKRLVPRIPFVCQGDFAIENLADLDAGVGMRSRANLANQIRDLPDGAQIQFNIVD